MTKACSKCFEGGACQTLSTNAKGAPTGCDGLQITITKLTSLDLMRRACEMTMHGEASQTTLARMYDCEHSPIRTQLFWVELVNVPTFVSVHFVRHKIGVEHFATTNREDRGGEDEVTRFTQVNHGMLVNAQALINMARKRLCGKAHEATRYVMAEMVKAVKSVDADLAKFLVPDCIYRGGKCHEPRSCGRIHLLDLDR